MLIGRDIAPSDTLIGWTLKNVSLAAGLGSFCKFPEVALRLNSQSILLKM
jgi:hypothetical protein